MKRLFYLLLFALFCANLPAQIAFKNANNLLPGNPVHSGSAIAVLDMNGDGLDDIVRLDEGTTLRIHYQTSPGQLFDSKQSAEITDDPVWGMCVADIDNNGFPDILTGGSYDGIKFVMANADGTAFSIDDKTSPGTFVQSVNLADIDNDGWLDATVCHDDGETRVFKNDGTGLMVFDPMLMDLRTWPSSDNSGNYGSVWTDLNNDTHLDFYIAKCRQGVTDPTDPRRINQLFMNQGDNTFKQDSTNWSGLRIGAQSWTADFGDIDNDGDMDVFITNHDVSSQVLENDGNAVFTDITASSGMMNAISGEPIQGIFRDFDNDGFLDILVAGSSHYVFRNNGNKTFSPVNNLFDNEDMESFAVGDLNSDGFVDILGGYANIYNNPTNIDDVLWMNEGNDNHFFGLKLRGVESNQSGVGARITIFTPNGKQIRDVRSGESYGIMNSLQVQFGLGASTQIDSVVVLWPSHHVDVIKSPAADQYLALEEGGCLVEPASIAAAGSTTICTGENVQISAPAGFASYLWSNGATTSSISATAAGIYKVTLTNALGCTTISNGIRVTVDPVEIPSIQVSGDSTFCKGESIVLTSNIGSAWNWSNGQTTQSITVTQSGTYTVSAKGLCEFFSSAPVKITVLNPELPVTTGDVTWPGGPATLSATGDEPHWFDAQTGGNEVLVGSEMSIPSLSQTTTFWVANNDIEDQPNEKTGPQNHQGTNGSAQFNGAIIFDAYKPFILKSVKVYSILGQTRNRVIDLRNEAGDVLNSKKISIPFGINTVEINLEIPAGQNLVLTTNEDFNQDSLNSASPQLRRSDQGVAYPYTIPGVLSIKSSDAPGSPLERYYYFYNWEVDFIGYECISDRVAVTATVDPNLVGTENPLAVSQIFVAPNPASGEAFVQTEGFSGEDFSVKLLDNQGRILQGNSKIKPENGRIRLDLNGLPNGLLVVEIFDGKKIGRAKFLKMD